MNISKFSFLILIGFLFNLFGNFEAEANEDVSKFSVLIETGGVWQNRNDTQIPPGAGSRVAIDEFDDGPFFHHRIEAFYRFKKKHALRLVYAPSSIKVSGSIDNDVVFNDTTFSNTEDLDIDYKFNSYRLSYIYGFKGFGKSQLNLGFTLKVRDAATTFRQPGLTDTYDNVGVVPLIYFEYQRPLSDKLLFNFNVDALGASQGRAIDVAVKLRREMNENTQLGIGLRSLEGGAENDKVFTFSWFNYLVLDLMLNF